jgi:hypothetical protein
METGLQGGKLGDCKLLLSANRLDTEDPSAAYLGAWLKTQDDPDAQAPDSLLQKKIAGLGTWVTPTSVLSETFSSPSPLA